MDTGAFIDGLIWYLYLVIIITFHECGHAWMASRCGDDTARSQGRVTLNPISHIDPIGTVMLPLLIVFLGAAGSGLGRFIIGWGRPVPVNPYNLGKRDRDQLLVAMAGPAMNVFLAFAALLLTRVAVFAFDGLGLGNFSRMAMEMGSDLAMISMFLCFFNLLPIPPLDGSYVMRQITGMSYETYAKISRFGFFIVIVVIQFPFVREFLARATVTSVNLMAAVLRL